MLVLFAVLVCEVVVIGRRPHEPSMRECTIAITVYVVSALLFAAGVFWLRGPRYGGEFLLGWLTEYSLSIDNLFIFLIIMAKMRVPRHLQQYALMIGIILALVLRGVFIALGATLISQFAWVFFIFGAFLVYTAVGLVREYLAGESEDDVTESFAIRVVRSRFRFTEDFHGKRIQVKVEQRRRMTPMFLVIVALGSTDLMFALDSIPAIYGLTKEPFLVFTANVFALMGLRQLYFLLGNMLRRLVYLSLGLSVILAFIGALLCTRSFDRMTASLMGSADRGHCAAHSRRLPGCRNCIVSRRQAWSTWSSRWARSPELSTTRSAIASRCSRLAWAASRARACCSSNRSRA